MTILGSGGWMPTARRETSSVLLRSGSDALLLDAGSGVRRLVERRELLDGVASVHVALTHFHLDHVVGLSYVPALRLEEPPVVWGPGRSLYGASTRSVLELLLGRPFFGAPLESIAPDVRELAPPAAEVGPFAVAIRRQDRHADPTLALRVGDELAYCTDTAHDPKTAPFSAGVDLLLHEAWHAARRVDDPGHTAAGEAAALAAEAGARCLVLVHVNPALADDEELRRFAAEVFPDSVVGTDLLEASA